MFLCVFLDAILLFNPDRFHILTDLLVNLNILITGSFYKPFPVFGVYRDAILSLKRDTFYSSAE